jgi:hypothetical protein
MNDKPLLINVRGTCGSGKSRVVNAVRQGRPVVPVFEMGRIRPVGYTGDRLFIAGHYGCGKDGMDSFRTVDDAYDVIDRWGRHRNVLCEGKAQNRDAEYLLGRQLSFKVIVIFLTTDLEEAIATVQSREHNCVTEDIVRRTYRKCQHDREMLLKGGVMMWSESRDDAIKLIEQWCDGELR